MVDPEPCKDLRRRMSAAIHGWDRPLLTFTHPAFEDVAHLGLLFFFFFFLRDPPKSAVLLFGRPSKQPKTGYPQRSAHAQHEHRPLCPRLLSCTLVA